MRGCAIPSTVTPAWRSPFRAGDTPPRGAHNPDTSVHDAAARRLPWPVRSPFRARRRRHGQPWRLVPKTIIRDVALPFSTPRSALSTLLRDSPSSSCTAIRPRHICGGISFRTQWGSGDAWRRTLLEWVDPASRLRIAIASRITRDISTSGLQRSTYQSHDWQALSISEFGDRLVALQNGLRMTEAGVELQSLRIEGPGAFVVCFSRR